MLYEYISDNSWHDNISYIVTIASDTESLIETESKSDLAITFSGRTALLSCG